MDDQESRPAIGAPLWWGLVASTLVYVRLWWMSPRYELGVPTVARPILEVLWMYVLATLIAFGVLAVAVRRPNTRALAAWVLGTSALFRLILLPTPPFQEIDIYRYLWDGAVVTAGGDPYAYPPQRIVDTLNDPAAAGDDAKLACLGRLAGGDPALEKIVRTIHYGVLPTPYPPVSQAVFAVASATTPRGATATGRLNWLKGWLTLFDLATLLLVMDLLRTTRLPIGWALVYGWSPLVMKEIAGSGHLDAIATFFAIAAVAVTARVLVATGPVSLGGPLFASALLGLGVGAKLFPVVLAPVVAGGLLATRGWRTTLLGAGVFLGVSAATLAPMFWPSSEPPRASTPRMAEGVEDLPPPADIEAQAEESGNDKLEGLAAFIETWEMNDLLFMVAYENLRSQAGVAQERTPWFDFTPESWSEAWVGKDRDVFRAVRRATLALLGAMILVWTWRSAARLDGSAESIRGWLRTAFLSLAWFWMLAPTQNPWYWCWAIPLLPWAGSRAWVVISLTVFGYYLRFWFEAHFPAIAPAGEPLPERVLGTRYYGEYFFYFVIPWLEFAPSLAWIALRACWPKNVE